MAGGPIFQPNKLQAGRHGNTSPGRLNKLDEFLELYEPSLFNQQASTRSGCAPQDVCVDLGFGDTLDTLAALAARFSRRRRQGSLAVIGTEAEPGRLNSGKAALRALGADDSAAVELRLGSEFQLPLRPDESPVLIRALNVLRDYQPQQARDALRRLAAQLAPGGLLVEGSASTPGHLAVVALVRRGRLERREREHRDGEAQEGAHVASAASTDDKLFIEAVCFCVDFDHEGPRLKGRPNEWFLRFLPQLWQHQSTRSAGGKTTKKSRLKKSQARLASDEPLPVNRSTHGTAEGTQSIDMKGQQDSGEFDSAAINGRNLAQGGGSYAAGMCRFLAAWAEVAHEDEQTSLKHLDGGNGGGEPNWPANKKPATAREKWERSVQGLADRVPGIIAGVSGSVQGDQGAVQGSGLGPDFLGRGFLVWRPPPGSLEL